VRLRLTLDSCSSTAEKFIKHESTSHIAKDAGGPTRQFLDELWKQMGSLTVKCPNGTDINLFIVEPVGFVPQSDEVIDHNIESLNYLERKEIIARLGAFYKAIGRMFALCLLSISTNSPFTIAAQALPCLYRNGKL
jgi:hypothetical protein